MCTVSGGASRTAARVAAWQLVLLGAVTTLGALSIDLYLPAFPELGSSEAAVQLTLTACAVGLSTDRRTAVARVFGRRMAIIFGLLAWSVASVACTLVPSIATLTALRFRQGLAGAAGLVVARPCCATALPVTS